jgi:hypothetical protein
MVGRKAMQKWEYMQVMRIDTPPTTQWTINDQSVGVTSFIGLLNQMGTDGWELVGFTGTTTTFAFGSTSGAAREYILKRPLP